MKLRIGNMLGIVEAEMELQAGRVVSVTGGNASGKSSLAIAAGAVLAREDNPLGATSTQVKLYMHDGAIAGECSLVDDEGSVRWFMPTGDLEQTPGVVHSSAAAVGLEDFIAHRSPAQLSALWEGLFLPPSEKIVEQLRKRLAPVVDETSIERIINQIKANEDDPTVTADRGWTLAHNTYQERAKRSKQDWMRVTGESWGRAKGADWHPERWLAEYDGVTVTDAQRAVEEAESATQAAHVAHAVDASVVEAAQEAKRQIPAADAALTSARAAALAADERASGFQQERDDLMDKHMAASRKLTGLRRQKADLEDGGSVSQPCPCCGEELVVIDGKLAQKPDNSEMIANLDKQIAAAGQEAGAAKTALDAAEEALQAPLEAVGEADSALREAEAELAGLRRNAREADAQVQTEEMVKALDEARLAEQRLRGRLDLISAKHRAAELHGNIIQYEMVAKLLSPTGVRADVMSDALKKVNTVLDRFSTITGWPKVEVGSKYGIAIGGGGCCACARRRSGCGRNTRSSSPSRAAGRTRSSSLMKWTRWRARSGGSWSISYPSLPSASRRRRSCSAEPVWTRISGASRPKRSRSRTAPCGRRRHDAGNRQGDDRPGDGRPSLDRGARKGALRSLRGSSELSLRAHPRRRDGRARNLRRAAQHGARRWLRCSEA